jgi:hypothetical protein
LLKILPKPPTEAWDPQDLKDEIKGQSKELEIIYKQFAEDGKELTYPHFWDQDQVFPLC